MSGEKFKPGDELFHKATRKRCVVIKENEDGTIKVRTEDNDENDYHLVELRRGPSQLVRRKRKPLY